MEKENSTDIQLPKTDKGSTLLSETVTGLLRSAKHFKTKM